MAVEAKGYMIDATFDGTALVVHAHNKAAAIALAGKEQRSDVVITRAEIAGVDWHGANMLKNGNLIVRTLGGEKYQLHFRRKQTAEFEALRDALT